MYPVEKILLLFVFWFLNFSFSSHLILKSDIGSLSCITGFKFHDGNTVLIYIKPNISEIQALVLDSAGSPSKIMSLGHLEQDTPIQFSTIPLLGSKFLLISKHREYIDIQLYEFPIRIASERIFDIESEGFTEAALQQEIITIIYFQKNLITLKLYNLNLEPLKKEPHEITFECDDLLSVSKQMTHILVHYRYSDFIYKIKLSGSKFSKISLEHAYNIFNNPNQDSVLESKKLREQHIDKQHTSHKTIGTKTLKNALDLDLVYPSRKIILITDQRIIYSKSSERYIELKWISPVSRREKYGLAKKFIDNSRNKRRLQSEIFLEVEKSIVECFDMRISSSLDTFFITVDVIEWTVKSSTPSPKLSSLQSYLLNETYVRVYIPSNLIDEGADYEFIFGAIDNMGNFYNTSINFTVPYQYPSSLACVDCPYQINQDSHFLLNFSQNNFLYDINFTATVEPEGNHYKLGSLLKFGMPEIFSSIGSNFTVRASYDDANGQVCAITNITFAPIPQKSTECSIDLASGDALVTNFQIDCSGFTSIGTLKYKFFQMFEKEVWTQITQESLSPILSSVLGPYIFQPYNLLRADIIDTQGSANTVYITTDLDVSKIGTMTLNEFNTLLAAKYAAGTSPMILAKSVNFYEAYQNDLAAYSRCPHCGGHGTCLMVTCECYSGWTGHNCTYKTSEMNTMLDFKKKLMTMVNTGDIGYWATGLASLSDYYYNDLNSMEIFQEILNSTLQNYSSNVLPKAAVFPLMKIIDNLIKFSSVADCNEVTGIAGFLQANMRALFQIFKVSVLDGLLPGEDEVYQSFDTFKVDFTRIRDCDPSLNLHEDEYGDLTKILTFTSPSSSCNQIIDVMTLSFATDLYNCQQLKDYVRFYSGKDNEILEFTTPDGNVIEPQGYIYFPEIYCKFKYDCNMTQFNLLNFSSIIEETFKPNYEKYTLPFFGFPDWDYTKYKDPKFYVMILISVLTFLFAVLSLTKMKNYTIMDADAEIREYTTFEKLRKAYVLNTSILESVLYKDPDYNRTRKIMVNYLRTMGVVFVSSVLDFDSLKAPSFSFDFSSIFSFSNPAEMDPLGWIAFLLNYIVVIPIFHMTMFCFWRPKKRKKLNEISLCNLILIILHLLGSVLYFYSVKYYWILSLWISKNIKSEEQVKNWGLNYMVVLGQDVLFNPTIYTIFEFFLLRCFSQQALKKKKPNLILRFFTSELTRKLHQKPEIPAEIKVRNTKPTRISNFQTSFSRKNLTLDSETRHNDSTAMLKTNSDQSVDFMDSKDNLMNIQHMDNKNKTRLKESQSESMAIKNTPSLGFESLAHRATIIIENQKNYIPRRQKTDLNFGDKNPFAERSKNRHF